jgi:hypothetical protein
MIKRFLAFLALASLLPSPLLAWWEHGRKSVATIAFRLQSRHPPSTGEGDHAKWWRGLGTAS